jgi:hypothetical protein
MVMYTNKSEDECLIHTHTYTHIHTHTHMYTLSSMGSPVI